MEKLSEGEWKLMELLWEDAPVNSTQLVARCREKLQWSKSTTYTVLRRLCHKGRRPMRRPPSPPWSPGGGAEGPRGGALPPSRRGVPLPHRLFQRPEAHPEGGGGAETAHRPAHLGGMRDGVWNHAAVYHGECMFEYGGCLWSVPPAASPAGPHCDPSAEGVAVVRILVLRAVLHGVGMYLLSSRAAGHRMGPSGRLRGQKL